MILYSEKNPVNNSKENYMEKFEKWEQNSLCDVKHTKSEG